MKKHEMRNEQEKYEVDQRPPSSEKPAMAYTSSENWQKYDVNVLLCKQDCTPVRDYISFALGLSLHLLLILHPIKISILFLRLPLLVWGIEPLAIAHTLYGNSKSD